MKKANAIMLLAQEKCHKADKTTEDQLHKA
jgi:hypothetical protein